MTKEQAVALFDSKFWEPLTPRERAEFQMFEDRLCMPFDVFHEALETTLGRPVWTHEMAMNRAGIQKELRGDRGAPSVQEIIDLIPADKRVVLAQT